MTITPWTRPATPGSRELIKTARPSGWACGSTPRSPTPWRSRPATPAARASTSATAWPWTRWGGSGSSVSRPTRRRPVPTSWTWRSGASPPPAPSWRRGPSASRATDMTWTASSTRGWRSPPRPWWWRRPGSTPPATTTWAWPPSTCPAACWTRRLGTEPPGSPKSPMPSPSARTARCGSAAGRVRNWPSGATTIPDILSRRRPCPMPAGRQAWSGPKSPLGWRCKAQAFPCASTAAPPWRAPRGLKTLPRSTACRLERLCRSGRPSWPASRSWSVRAPC